METTKLMIQMTCDLNRVLHCVANRAAMLAVMLMIVICAKAQRIEVVDAEGHGIPMVSVLTEDGNLIGTTDLSGVLADVKGAGKVALTHVAYKPQLVDVNSLANGRMTLEDIGYNLQEIVVTPKPYIYVEAFYRVYVYRDDSLCYFLSGIMPNAYDPQKKKLEHGSYYQAYAEYCEKMGAAITWGARTQEFNAGKVHTKGLPSSEMMQSNYFTTVDHDSHNLKTYNNPQGPVGQLVRANGQTRLTLDGGKMQMYVNEVKGQTKQLERRQEKGYEYQYTLVFNSEEEEQCDVSNFLMVSHHWEYNDKKSHVKFFIENYATDHYYMDKQEWKDRKKAIKEEYGASMTLDKIEAYATSHNIPALSPATRQAIGKLRQW